jgi:hypothetical protein
MMGQHKDKSKIASACGSLPVCPICRYPWRTCCWTSLQEEKIFGVLENVPWDGMRWWENSTWKNECRYKEEGSVVVWTLDTGHIVHTGTVVVARVRDNTAEWSSMPDSRDVHVWLTDGAPWVTVVVVWSASFEQQSPILAVRFVIGYEECYSTAMERRKSVDVSGVCDCVVKPMMHKFETCGGG